jgi:hypothetical protein
VKHYVVKTVTLGDHFSFSYDIPQAWLWSSASSDTKKLPKLEDYVAVAEDGLRRNITESHRMVIAQQCGLSPETTPMSNVDTSSAVSDQPPPWILRPDVARRLIEDAKRARRQDAEECLRRARRSLWIIGQNLYAISNPARDLHQDKQKYKRLIFSRLLEAKRKTKKFSITIALVNPEESAWITLWHRIHTPKKSENPHNFVRDLRSAFRTFSSWQKEAERRRLALSVRCIPFSMRSYNVVDPEDSEYGFITYTNTWQDNILDTRSRRWQYLACDAQGYQDLLGEVKNRCLKKSKGILDVRGIDWKKLIKEAEGAPRLRAVLRNGT